MRNCLPSGAIHIKGLRLWTHVGVLEYERLTGQWFNLDISIWLDCDLASEKDDLSKTFDYSLAILEIQRIAFGLECQTIEHFSERIFEVLEKLYGIAPMKLLLSKCSVPIEGFNGQVTLERFRHWP